MTHRVKRRQAPLPFEFYASCPEGFEEALAEELRGLGLPRVRPLKGRVSFAGDAAAGERACLWSRLASRVHVVLARFGTYYADELYEGVYTLPWERLLAPGASIAVSARGTTDELRNTHFTALRVKDAVCDRLADETGRRADVDTERPDARLSVSLRGDRVTISLDLSGEPLFRRMPRLATKPGAPAHFLRPDYAALLLTRAGWAAACRDAARTGADEDAAVAGLDTPGTGAPAPIALLDACCAGGGAVHEAASMLADVAPGLARRHWGFFGWGAHDAEAWNQLVEEADSRAEAGCANGRGRIIACDQDGRAASFAERVMRGSGLSEHVTFVPADANEIERALATGNGASARAFAVADALEVPLTQAQPLLTLVARLRGSEALAGAPFATIAPDTLLARALGCPPALNARIMPGNEEARLLAWPALDAAGSLALGRADADGAVDGEPDPDAHCAAGTARPATTVDVGQGKPVPVLIAESSQFANRLKKNARRLRKWARREGVSCYRVYDADLPDYSAAIDLYEGSAATPGRWLVVAEYAAPRTVDAAIAQARMLDILALAPRILDVDPAHVYARSRTRSRGGSQYGRREEAGAAPAHKPLIEEGGLTFEVNFDDYLDTGIFLDHRVTRGIVREHARATEGGRFLNLFAYTGTATCYAADAGVSETVTVDLSNTYLDWAERNMELNGFTGREHHFVREDVMRWIGEQRRGRNRWDLIFCDPPTFSNSAKMGQRTWDVQRDHVELLIGVSRLLTRGGEAIFSCNLRGFRPDIDALAAAGVELADITAETIPEDFTRNKKIHHCYLVRRI